MVTVVSTPSSIPTRYACRHRVDMRADVRTKTHVVICGRDLWCLRPLDAEQVIVEEVTQEMNRVLALFRKHTR